MRAFIAVEGSVELRDAIADLEAELDERVPNARWVPPENLHLTVRFLGNTEENMVDALTEDVRSAVATCPPFSLSFRGIGLFPSPRRPRVISVLIPAPPRELEELYRKVEAAAIAHGFPPESRAFRPHLTFARLKKNTRALRGIEERLANRSFGEAWVREVIVFESVLRRSGAVYHARARLPLDGGSPS